MNTIRSIMGVAQHCVLCGSEGDNGLALCAPCREELHSQTKVCRRCGLPLAAVGESDPVCGACLRASPPYTSVYRFADYGPPMDRLIQHLKFNEKLYIARLLGTLMAHDIRARCLPLPDMILPVPLHKQRLRKRGFNQAVEIGRILSRSLGVVLDLQSCTRIKPTPEQSGLPAKQRKTNIQGVFQVKESVKGKHIAILDDVMTTGSTVNELADSLIANGSQRIDVWVCARAVLL